MPIDDSSPLVQNYVVDENEDVDSSKADIEQGKVDEAREQKVDQQLGKFLAMVKNLEVTISFNDLISQVLCMLRFLKI